MMLMCNFIFSMQYNKPGKKNKPPESCGLNLGFCNLMKKVITLKTGYAKFHMANIQ